jgi:hypothetical protein
MTITRTLLSLASVLTLLAVAPAYAAAPHTVPWYVSNPTALQHQLAACAADPGNLTQSPDCLNANAAQEQIAFRAL